MPLAHFRFTLDCIAINFKVTKVKDNMTSAMYVQHSYNVFELQL